jgi:predicted kinase
MAALMPTLAIFCGLPGSGKTTLALPFAQAHGWTYISRDEIRRALYPDDAPDVWKPKANLETERRTREALAGGHSIVVDGATFAASALRARFAQAAQDHAARFVTVWVDCPIDEAIRRVAASNAGHPAAAERNADRVREVAGRFEAPVDALRLDALQSVPALMQMLRRELLDNNPS